jgi:predicted ArsR family transcriptional regulator
MTPSPTWTKRFFETTRGRIVSLLSSATRTVSELASHLGMTENAVRAQLATLERDGLARQSGTRPGFRKPNFAYDLTPEGHQLFPKLYAPVLGELLDVLMEREGEEQTKAALGEAAERLARRHLRELYDLPPEQRLGRLVELLEEAGAPVTTEQQPDGLLIRGCSCPLASAVKSRPELCQVLAGLLSKVLQRPVVETCDRAGPPRCCFHVADAPTR